MSFYFRNGGFGSARAGALTVHRIEVLPPRVRFVEGVSELGAAQPSEQFAFDDFHEESNFGFFAVKPYCRISTEATPTGARAFSPSRRPLGLIHDAMVKRVNPFYARVVQVDDAFMNMEGFDIQLSRRLPGRLVFTYPDSGVDQALNKRLVVEKAMSRIYNEFDMYVRYFPKFISEYHSQEEIFDLIDSLFARSYTYHIGLGFSVAMQGVRYRTVGHVIYHMLLKRNMQGGSQYDNINLRLLLLALSVAATCSEEDIPVVLSEMFKWLVIGACDSCVEKVLLAQAGADRLEYDFSAFGDESRPFWLKEIRVAFRSLPHGSDTSHYAYAITHLSHGVFTVSGTRDLAQMHFMINANLGCDISLNVGLSLMIRELISIIVRASRASMYGHHNLLLSWIREKHTRVGSFETIDDYIIELVALCGRIPLLSSCFKSMILALYFGKVPGRIVEKCRMEETADNYDSVTYALFNMFVVDIQGVLSYLMNVSVSVPNKKRFLQDDDRVLPLKALCGLR